MTSYTKYLLLLLIIFFMFLLGRAVITQTLKTSTLPVVILNAAPTLASMSDFQKGIVYASWWHGEYSSALSDSTLSQHIKPIGVNWIEIVVTCYQKRAISTEIQCKQQQSTPTDDDLVHVIQYSHMLGLRVMLKPHIDLANEPMHWRGSIGFGNNEAAWKEWFASYTRFITHYAALAQSAGVDYFIVGTELAGTSHRSDEWRTLIKSVRKIYRGPVTYAAHHDTEVFKINWWDALDTIGLDAYFPLSQNGNHTVEELKAAWTPIVLRLERLSETWNRQIILTEIGYQSHCGSTRTPCGSSDQPIDFQGQADAYEAAFEAFAGKKWWQGVFWWVWTVGNSPSGDFSPHDKTAEEVLRKHFGAAGGFQMTGIESKGAK